MAEQANDPGSREERLNAILAAYLDAAAAGQPPDRAELLARHPDFAAELTSFFADNDGVRQLAEPLRLTPSSAAETPTLPPGEVPPAPLPGAGQCFGDYELLEEIARGGMGVVFKARQRSLDRIVALKMILAGKLAGEADVQRFRQEAQTAARLQHPGIVPLHEVGEHQGQHYFSMDYIEGRSLADLVRDNPLPPQQAIRYVRLIAEAVHFAHGHGVLHRDLKPSNVLIDRFDQPRVTDFGLAKDLRTDARLTASDAVVGTPSYMPPEQVSQERGKLSPASDTYALGPCCTSWSPAGRCFRPRPPSTRYGKCCTTSLRRRGC
jgi:serine/threonine-protein kinase